MWKTKHFFHFCKNLYLRYKEGIGCCDVFSMDCYYAPKLLRDLKIFRRNLDTYPSHPNDLTMEEWKQTIDKMIYAFNYLIKEINWPNLSEEEYNKAKEGFELFGKYYMSLWL